MDELFDKEIFNMTVDDLLKEINDLITDYSPKGKTVDNFTGGYIQQLKNSTQMVLYFGTKGESKNRDTVKVEIEQDEVDQAYMMLKAKIHDMRNNGASKVKTSLAQRRLAKKSEEEIF